MSAPTRSGERRLDSVPRRTTLWMCAALLVALLPTAARAQSPASFNFARPTNYRSPQRFYLEIKFGPYVPHIDSTVGLAGTPFSDTFGELNTDGTLKNPGKVPGRRLLTTVEFDWQFWHGVGSLALAGSVGIMRRSAKAFSYNADGSICQPSATVACPRSGDNTALTVLPLELQLVYRFDLLAQRWRVPLVPYLKGGLAYYLWFVQNGAGLSHFPPPPLPAQERALGGSWGLVAHPGLAFQVDALDQNVARVLDSELGINHIYFFAELNYAWITNFNIGKKIILSDLSWTAGLAFEF